MSTPSLWTISRGLKLPATLHPSQQVGWGPQSLCLEGRDIALARVWAVVVWPGEGPGYFLVAGETDSSGSPAGSPAGVHKHVYLLHEASQPEWQELTRKLVQARKALSLGLILHEGGAASQAYADRANRLVSEEGLTDLEPWGQHQTLGFSQAPWLEHGRFLMGLVRDAVANSRLTLMPGLDLLLGQIKQAQSLTPAEVVKQLPELFALKALAMLLGAFDCWPLSKPQAEQKLVLEPMDKRAGF
jgi:hypothetical protein